MPQLQAVPRLKNCVQPFGMWCMEVCSQDKKVCTILLYYIYIYIYMSKCESLWIHRSNHIAIHSTHRLLWRFTRIYADESCPGVDSRICSSVVFEITRTGMLKGWRKVSETNNQAGLWFRLKLTAVEFVTKKCCECFCKLSLVLQLILFGQKHVYVSHMGHSWSHSYTVSWMC